MFISLKVEGMHGVCLNLAQRILMEKSIFLQEILGQPNSPYNV